MPHNKPDWLLAAAKIIIIVGQGLVALTAIAITIGLPIIIIMQETLSEELQQELNNPDLAFPTLAVAGVLVLALLMFGLAFVSLKKLRRIIDTVDDGDPFVPSNAERLTAMAWLMLFIQIIAIPAAGIALYLAKIMEEQDAMIDAGLDFNGVLIVIILFILARVVRHGTAMRDDLEGTV